MSLVYPAGHGSSRRSPSVRLFARRLLLTLGCATAWACIPLPVPREAQLQPALDLSVVAGPSGAPIAQALVTVVRYYYPHGVVDHWSEHRTDPQGRVALPELTEHEWVFPLMMHGVPEYHHAIAVSAPGYYHALRRADELPPGLEVQLWPSSTSAPALAALSAQEVADFARLSPAGPTLYPADFLPPPDHLSWCSEHSDLEVSGTVRSLRLSHQEQGQVSLPLEVLTVAVASSAGPRAPAPPTVDAWILGPSGAAPGTTLQLFLRWEAEAARYTLVFGRIIGFRAD